MEKLCWKVKQWHGFFTSVKGNRDSHWQRLLTDRDLCNEHNKRMFLLGWFSSPRRAGWRQMINELVNTGTSCRLPHRGPFCIRSSWEAFGTWRHDSALSGKTPGPGGAGVRRWGLNVNKGAQGRKNKRARLTTGAFLVVKRPREARDSDGLRG